MQRSAKKSILCIGQDNLFAELPGCAVDHLRTGTTITPRGDRSGGKLGHLPSILARLCLGKYDLIALPAIDFDWIHDDSPIKRAVRTIVSRALRTRAASACVNRLFSRAATVIVLDRYDSDDLRMDFLNCLRCARYYFKTNLRETDDGRKHEFGKSAGCQFKHLPYWIAIENYDVPFQREKDIDIFFAGTVNSEPRRASIQSVWKLQESGYRVVIKEGHLPFAEYLSLMSRSWLTLSPQGYGYNGFRHYESMLVGSVPLINLPNPPIVNDFRHGQNCFFYSTSRGDLNRVIEIALSDKHRLLQIAERLREFVAQRHSIRAVGEYLLGQALADCGTGDRQLDNEPPDETLEDWSSVFDSPSSNGYAIPLGGTGRDQFAAGRGGA